jgi:tetratricopeptide (TPR) repeat protein
MVAMCSLVACSRDPEIAKRDHVQRGKALLAAEKPREAMLEFRNALRYDEKFGEARLFLAEALLAVGDRPGSATEFVRAADLLPDAIEVQLKAGNALLVANQFADAETRADLVLKREPQNPQALLLKGHALAGLQRIDDAIKQIEEAITLNAGAGAHTSLGMLQLHRGQGMAAETTFKRAVQAAPQSVLAHLSLGQFYWMTGRNSEAEAALLRAVELAPSHAAANRAAAAFYLSTRRPLEAEKFLKAFVEHGNDPTATIVLADYYAITGRQQEALAILRSAASDEGLVGIAATLRAAEIDYASGRKEQAQRAIDAVVAKAPRNSAAHVLKARLLLTEGKPTEALPLAQSAVSLDPESAAAHYTLGLIHQALDDPAAATRAFTEVLKVNPRAVDAQTRLAAIHLATGKAATTVSLAEAAVRTAPGNREAQLLLVQGLIATGDISRAETDARALVTRHPDWAAAHTALATAQLRRGNFAAAEQEFGRALQLQPGDLDAIQGMVTVYVNTKRTAEGRQYLNARLAERPNDAGLLVLVAELDVQQRDLAAAERHYIRAIEADPNHLNAYARLARLYAHQRRLGDATQKYDEIAARQPQNVMAHTMVGLLLQVQKRTAEASDRYRKVLEIDPRAAVAANNLAWQYAEEGSNLEQALQLAQTAKQELPNNAGVTDTLGWVYYKKNFSSQAIQAFEEAIKSDPRNPTYHYHAGLAYLQAGNMPKARASLTEALNLPGFADRDAARKLLTGIQQ